MRNAGNNCEHIIISGWYGNKNIGDEAILASIIQTIKRLSSNSSYFPRITVLSDDPRYTQRIHQVDSLQQIPMNPIGIVSHVLKGSFFKFIAKLKKADIFILGSGGFLSDWQSWVVILDWLGQLLIAKLFRKKTIIYAIGAGPISTPIGRFLTKILINTCADAITVRDQKSFKILKEVGVTKKISITVDPAINFNPQCKKGSTKKIAVIIPTIPHNHPHADMIQKINDYIIGALINEGFKIYVLPFQLPSDEKMAKKLVSRREHNASIIIVDNPYLVSKILQNADIVISTRLHGVILSASMCIPVFALVYHHKIYEFQRMIGLSGFSINIGDGINWPYFEYKIDKSKINILTSLKIIRKIKHRLNTIIPQIKSRDLKNQNLLGHLCTGGDQI